jgi:hypothetical protein
MASRYRGLGCRRWAYEEIDVVGVVSGGLVVGNGVSLFFSSGFGGVADGCRLAGRVGFGYWRGHGEGGGVMWWRFIQRVSCMRCRVRLLPEVAYYCRWCGAALCQYCRCPRCSR